MKRFGLIWFFFILLGCQNILNLLPVTPEAEFDKSAINKKLPLNTVVVFDDYMLKNLKGACCTYDFKGTKKLSSYSVWVNSSETSVDLFKKAFSLLFERVEYVDQQSKIDENQYDLIIYPKVRCNLSFERTERSYRKHIQRAKYKIDSTVFYTVKFLSKEYNELFTANGGNVENVEVHESISGGRIIADLISLDCKDNVKVSIQKAFNTLIRDITESEQLESYALNKRYQKTQPANLIAKVKYFDSDSIIPNNSIDAGESSQIIVLVSNSGNGTAFDVKLSATVNNENIEIPKFSNIGDILPGETRELKIPLVATLNLQASSAECVIQAEERRGYHSKQYRLKVPAKESSRPGLAIVDYKLNDSNTGMASGNGNGIPENGETIEILSFIKNQGKGDAVKVSLQLKDIAPGIEIVKGATDIDKISVGQTASETLAYRIPATFNASQTAFKIIASDVRGIDTAEKLFTLKTESRSPLIAYEYRIIDQNGNGKLENGEEAELELSVKNKGQLEARNIQIEVSSPDIQFKQSDTRISRIAPVSTYVPQRFPFSVPRTIAVDKITISIDIRQSDFPGVASTITKDLNISRPDFLISHQILDQGNHNGKLEEGEAADIAVRVQNSGNIAARDVKLTLKTDGGGFIQEGVRLVSKDSYLLGRIAPGDQCPPQNFSVFAQRSGMGGLRDLKLLFQVEQKDFKNVPLALDLKIYPEKEEIITVADQRQTAPGMQPVSTSANAAPLTAIGWPQNGQRVTTSLQKVAGMVSDDKGVASIEILVNGRKINAGRGIPSSTSSGSDNRQKPFSFDVPLQIGKNIITVRAYDFENLSNVSTIEVYRESEKGNIYAAVVGIDRYQNVPQLRYACKDARSFAQYLRSNMGLSDDRLFELYNEDATVARMRTVLGRDLRQLASRPEDTVIIFFAGHGAPESDAQSTDSDGITKYLLPCSADPENLYATAIPMYEVARLFNRIRAERLVFISDACFSGASGGRTILSAGMRAGNLSDGFLERLARGKGRIILTSSSANEVSQESDELGHGVFTYYLLRGLNGAADVDNDNMISTDEISFYLNKHVREATKGAQTPVKKGDSEGAVIIGRSLN